METTMFCTSVMRVCAAMMLLGVRVGFCLYTARGTEIFSIVAISKALF